MYDINIVIVNWKMRDDIDRCLSSLFNDLKGGDIKAIVHVVDNSANIDGVKELLAQKYPEAVYVDAGGNIGFGRAQNMGLLKEKARYYLPLNPDIEFLPNSNTLKRMIGFMEDNSEVGISAPKLLNTDGSTQYSSYRYPSFFTQFYKRLNLDKKCNLLKKKVDYYLMRDFDREKTVPVDWVMGSFMFIRNELAEKIGFFDDRYFMYFEDCDLCRRTWRAGFKVFYIHDIKVRHGHRRDSDGGSLFKLIFKNPVFRIHMKSWFKYFKKWGIRRDKYGI